MATLGSQEKGVLGPGSVSAAFQSLVNRSIAALETINFVGQQDDYSTYLEMNRLRLRGLDSIETVLKNRSHWFFQLRSSFLDQDQLFKFDLSRLDRYILLPIDYGWVNNRDCYFISHYWRSASHPDPDGTDLRMFQQDLVSDTLWSYVWVDWTCAPQVDGDGRRTPLEQHYFEKMLQCMQMLVRDCAFEWRFPAWEPRAWILYEVAENALSHYSCTVTEDNRLFLCHVKEMVRFGVHSVLNKYKYRCTNASDMDLVTGKLEMLVILAKIFPKDFALRRTLLDYLNKPGSTVSGDWVGVKIDKAEGTIQYQGQVHRFTPILDFASSIGEKFQDNGKQSENGAERAPSITTGDGHHSIGKR